VEAQPAWPEGEDSFGIHLKYSVRRIAIQNFDVQRMGHVAQCSDLARVQLVERLNDEKAAVPARLPGAVRQWQLHAPGHACVVPGLLRLLDYMDVVKGVPQHIPGRGDHPFASATVVGDGDEVQVECLGLLQQRRYRARQHLCPDHGPVTGRLPRARQPP
jgi:hypothetical protein